MSVKKEQLKVLLGNGVPTPSSESTGVPQKIATPNESNELVNQSGKPNLSTDIVVKIGSQNQSTKSVDQEPKTADPESPAEEEEEYPKIYVRQKKTLDDTHKHKTFLIRRDLLAEWERIKAREDRGFETYYINELLEKAIKKILKTYKK